MSRRIVCDHVDQYLVARPVSGGVSRLSYHAARSCPLLDRYFADVEIAKQIYEIHTGSHWTYGAPRVDGQLQHAGRHHSTKAGRSHHGRVQAGRCSVASAGLRVRPHSAHGYLTPKRVRRGLDLPTPTPPAAAGPIVEGPRSLHDIRRCVMCGASTRSPRSSHHQWRDPLLEGGEDALRHTNEKEAEGTGFAIAKKRIAQQEQP